MENLLQKHGNALLSGISLSKFLNIRDEIIPAIEKACLTESASEAAAFAYYIGMAQGIHNERARRRRATI